VASLRRLQANVIIAIKRSISSFPTISGPYRFVSLLHHFERGNRILGEKEDIHFAKAEVVTVHFSSLANDGDEFLFNANQSIEAVQISTGFELQNQPSLHVCSVASRQSALRQRRVGQIDGIQTYSAEGLVLERTSWQRALRQDDDSFLHSIEVSLVCADTRLDDYVCLVEAC
jgi:hypothetical protein